MRSVGESEREVCVHSTVVDTVVAHRSRAGALACRCLERGRPHAAREAYSLGEARVNRWLASNRNLTVSRTLVRAGLLVSAELRDQRAYEAVLRNAQERWRVPLAEEPSLLSDAAVGCLAAGWADHAHAINLTLAAAGHNMSVSAANAFLERRLEDGDAEGAISAFVRMRAVGPAPDPRTRALATRAVTISRRGSWSSLRNALRSKRLRIGWSPNIANGALGYLLETGSMRAAAAAVAQMRATRAPLRLSSLRSLLQFASVTCASAPCASAVHEAMARRAAPAALGATDALLVLPHLDRGRREAFVRTALRDAADPSEALVLHAALSLIAASETRGDEAARWLLWLRAEGSEDWRRVTFP